MPEENIRFDRWLGTSRVPWWRRWLFKFRVWWLTVNPPPNVSLPPLRSLATHRYRHQDGCFGRCHDSDGEPTCFGEWGEPITMPRIK